MSAAVGENRDHVVGAGVGCVLAAATGFLWLFVGWGYSLANAGWSSLYYTDVAFFFWTLTTVIGGVAGALIGIEEED